MTGIATLRHTSRAVVGHLTRLLAKPQPKVLHPDPDQVREFYDRLSPAGLLHAGDIFQGCRPTSDEDLIEYLVASIGLQSGQRILDAGCGVCGPAIGFAHKLDLTIDALTISGVQAEIGRAKVRENRLEKKITVAQGDYHLLDRIYPAEHFDTVLFLESLGHAYNPGQVIRAVFRVLKPGGSVYIKDVFPLETDDPGLAVLRGRRVMKINKAFVYNCPDLHQTSSLLRRNGFEIMFIRRPGFEEDFSVVAATKNALGIDTAGGDEPITATETLEMLYRKLPS